jgi:ABC-type bacteriocin/lantibiotic exporter with double-glycine peptidase domain
VTSAVHTIRAALTIAALLATGCGPSLPGMSSTPPAARHIDNVPFFPDDTDQCGPSTLAAVLSFWKHPTMQDELRHEIYLTQLNGTLPMDMGPALEKRGLNARFYEGSLDDLKHNISAGHPVIAYLNLGFSFAPQGHYVVVTGFDDGRGGLTVHSGKRENAFVPYPKFERNWKKTDHWTLLAVPPGETPAPPP